MTQTTDQDTDLTEVTAYVNKAIDRLFPDEDKPTALEELDRDGATLLDRVRLIVRYAEHVDEVLSDTAFCKCPRDDHSYTCPVHGTVALLDRLDMLRAHGVLEDAEVDAARERLFAEAKTYGIATGLNMTGGECASCGAPSGAECCGGVTR